MYLKDTDMQDEEDLIMPAPFQLPAQNPTTQPIMYAEATASDLTPSHSIPLTIDQTQLNNLTRIMMSQDQSIYVNTFIYQQL